jgi:hypothetical protein
MMEEGVWFMADRDEQSRKTEEIQQMVYLLITFTLCLFLLICPQVKKKFQIILAYQIYNRNVNKGAWNEEKKKAFDMLLMKFHDFDMVFPEDIEREGPDGVKRKLYKSVMFRFLRNGHMKEYP